jgi:hypothetical protein
MYPPPQKTHAILVYTTPLESQRFYRVPAPDENATLSIYLNVLMKTNLVRNAMHI